MEAAAPAGLLDLLAVYGGYEAALRQAEAYTRMTEPTPVFTAASDTV